MKKWLSILLCLFLLLNCCLVFAEQAESSADLPDNDEFIFRDGIRWGMNEEEVIALEGEERERSVEMGFSAMMYEDVQISKYQGMLIYAFLEDQLVFSAYGIEDADEEMFDYLKTALETVYGKESEEFAEEIIPILNLLTGKEFQAENVQARPFVIWEAAENTRICLFKDSDLLIVLYVSPDFSDLFFSEEINTTGL